MNVVRLSPRQRTWRQPTALTPVLSVPQWSPWHQVWTCPTALAMYQEGNDLSERQLDELVERGLLRVVDGLDWDELEDERNVEQSETNPHDDPGGIDPDGPEGAGDPAGLSWDAGLDPDDSGGAAGDDLDGPGSDGPARDDGVD